MTDHIPDAEDKDKALISFNDLLGWTAYWAVAQHPYNDPRGLDRIIVELRCKTVDWEELGERFKFQWFSSASELRRWLHDALKDHPVLKDWNTPVSRHGREIIFSSRYDSVPRIDDFIDIDALIGNIARCAFEAARREP